MANTRSGFDVALLALVMEQNRFLYASLIYMAVEAVIGEPCSKDMPKNSEFTGHFLVFGALFNPRTSKNSAVKRSTRY